MGLADLGSAVTVTLVEGATTSFLSKGASIAANLVGAAITSLFSKEQTIFL